MAIAPGVVPAFCGLVLGAVLVEAFVYRRRLRLGGRRALGTSALANVASAAVGAGVGLVMSRLLAETPTAPIALAGLVVTLIVEVPIVARMNRDYAERRRLLRVASLANAATYAVGATVFAGMLNASARSPEVTRHAVQVPGLPAALTGLRVVQLTDLHVGPLFGSAAMRRAVVLANACEPDVVVLTGDFPHYRSMARFRRAAPELAGLRARLGVFACLGNHDHWEGAPEVQAILEGVGVRVLVNANTQVSRGLWLAGLDDLMSGQPDLDRTVQGIPDDAAVILLSHNPIVLPQVAERAWIVLAGHTHGGQIALPWLGPRGSMRLAGFRHVAYAWEWCGVRSHGGRTEAISSTRYPAGWYEHGRARMYVSRGVGFSQYWPFRLNCPSEIACFALEPGADPTARLGGED